MATNTAETAESKVTTYLVTVTAAEKPITSLFVGHARGTCTKRIPAPGAEGHVCNNDDVWIGRKAPLDAVADLDLPDSAAGSYSVVRVDREVKLSKAHQDIAQDVTDTDELGVVLGYVTLEAADE